MADLIKLLTHLFLEGIPTWCIVILLGVLLLKALLSSMKELHNQYLAHQSIKADVAVKEAQRKSIELDNQKKQKELNMKAPILILNPNESTIQKSINQ